MEYKKIILPNNYSHHKTSKKHTQIHYEKKVKEVITGKMKWDTRSNIPYMIKKRRYYYHDHRCIDPWISIQNLNSDEARIVHHLLTKCGKNDKACMKVAQSIFYRNRIQNNISDYTRKVAVTVSEKYVEEKELFLKRKSKTIKLYTHQYSDFMYFSDIVCD